MANLRLANATRSAMADGIDDQINAGAGAGLLRIYDGSQPAGPDTAVTSQTLLAEITLSDPAFGAASNGVITLSGTPLSDASANATGTASWARFVDSDGNAKVDCDVGTSGATINLNTTSIVSGGTVTITSGTITVPAS